MFVNDILPHTRIVFVFWTKKRVCVIVGREKNRSCWRQQTLHRGWCSAAWRSRRCTIPTIQLKPIALKTHWDYTHYTRARPTTQTQICLLLNTTGIWIISTQHTSFTFNRLASTLFLQCLRTLYGEKLVQRGGKIGDYYIGWILGSDLTDFA